MVILYLFKCLFETSKDHISKRQKIDNEIVFTQVIVFIVYTYIFTVEFDFNPPHLGRFGLLTRGVFLVFGHFSSVVGGLWKITKIKFETRALSIGDILARGYLKQLPQYAYLFPSPISNAFIIVIVIITIGSNLSSISIPLFSESRKSMYLFFL